MENCVISNIFTRRVSERIKKEREGFVIIVEEYSASESDSESEDLFQKCTKEELLEVKKEEEETYIDIIENSKTHYSPFVDIVQVYPTDVDKIDTKPPTCYQCQSTFKSIDKLLLHCVIHARTIGSVFQCNICKAVLKTRSFLRVHMLKHNWVRFKCRLCPRTFCSPTYQRQHLMHEHYGVKYKCPQCDKTYTQNANLKQHMLSHKGIYFTCFHCNRQFTHRALLVRHMEKHMNSKRYHCNICNRSITTYLKKYRLHMLHHQGLSKYECHICAKKFILKNSLKIHMAKHEDSSVHKCTVCKRKYSSEDALKKHMLRHTSAELKCDICGKTYASKKYLEEHLSQHKGHSYQCNKCEHTFTHFNNLKRHARHHDKDKRRYICAICNRTFYWKEALVGHLTTHDDERKTVTCKLCDVVLLGNYKSHAKSERHREKRRELRKQKKVK